MIELANLAENQQVQPNFVPNQPDRKSEIPPNPYISSRTRDSSESQEEVVIENNNDQQPSYGNDAQSENVRNIVMPPFGFLITDLMQMVSGSAPVTSCR